MYIYICIYTYIYIYTHIDPCVDALSPARLCALGLAGCAGTCSTGPAESYIIFGFSMLYHTLMYELYYVVLHCIMVISYCLDRY